MARLPKLGLVTVTDGAPRDPYILLAAGFRSSRQYADVRAREAAAALELLNRDITPVVNLGVPDQRAVFNVVKIARRLVQILRTNPFDVLVTHPYEGGHPDHDATALAAHAACLILAEAGSTPPMLVEMAGYHLVDGVEVHGDFMCNPAAGAVESFPLSEVEGNLKRRMFACHASQSNVLADSPLEAELFRRAALRSMTGRPP